jgi:enoyl-CoA hydratase/carnithine racemase
MAALVTVERLPASPANEVGTGAIAIVTLQRPERRNALSIALRDEMSDTLDALAADEALRVVVVTGAGAVFSAGFDLDEFGRLGEAEFAESLWASSDRWHRTVLEFPLPMVAAVNGAAYGGGFDLAVMCDLRIAATGARFAHPEHAFSQVVYAPLHDLVGGAVARDLALTGRVVDAEEAKALGLVTRVVAETELLDDATAVAREIARAPRDVLVRMKEKFARRAGIRFGATLDL